MINLSAAQRSLKLAFRGVVQLLAAGVLTAAAAFVLHLNQFMGGVVMIVCFAVVVFAHTYMEAAGKLVVLLPTTGLVSGQASFTEATMEASITPDEGKVEGVVTDVKGAVVGEVVGQLGTVGSIYDKKERDPKE